MTLRELVQVIDPGTFILIRDSDGMTPPVYSGDVYGTAHMRAGYLDRRVLKIRKEIWECVYHIEIRVGNEDERTE